MHETDLFDMFLEFSNVAHILAVILLHRVLQNDQTVLKTYLHSIMGQKCVSNLSYAYSVVNNDMDRIIDIFGCRNVRDNYFF